MVRERERTKATDENEQNGCLNKKRQLAVDGKLGLNFAQPLFLCTEYQIKIFESLESNTLGGGKKNPRDKRDPPLTNSVKHARYIGLMSGATKKYNAYMSVKCERARIKI